MLNPTELRRKLTATQEELEELHFAMIEAEGEELELLEEQQENLESELEELEDTISDLETRQTMSANER
jgi:hypothetical protein